VKKVRIEDLQEWFDDPEAELRNFQNSGQAIMSLMFGGSKRPIELNQRDVANLLIEIRANKLWRCDYCLVINFGVEEECIACGADRT
jgi:hypothetical protein